MENRGVLGQIICTKSKSFFNETDFYPLKGSNSQTVREKHLVKKNRGMGQQARALYLSINNFLQIEAIFHSVEKVLTDIW